MNISKNLSILLLVILWIQTGFSQDQAFITVWQTDAESNFGVPLPWDTEDNQIRIQAFGAYTYEWVELDEEGNTLDNFGNGSASDTEIISFPYPGIYQLSITPSGDNPFHRFLNEITVEGGGDSHKLLEVKQWGDVVWSSFENAFQNCFRLEITADDVPDLSQVTSLSKAFMGTTFETASQLENWDMSNIENLYNTFLSNPNFNQNIGNWEVSNVTNMGGMFSAATNFNQDISGWNVSAVQDMSLMFGNTDQFNQNIGNWDVSNVFDMAQMFSDAQAFNQDIGNWDVSSVADMNGMFHNAVFNQPIGQWDVSNVTIMVGMFSGNSFFNQDISNWDVSNVTRMASMFANNSIFDGDISNWNVSSVTNMSRMFDGNEGFNGEIGNWDVSNVVSMTRMFANNHTFHQGIGNWDVSNVESMAEMFSNSSYNQDISNWNVSNLIQMGEMFFNAQAFNQDISGWEVGNVEVFSGIFTGALKFNQNLGSWNLSSTIRYDHSSNDFSFANSGMSCENYSETLKGWQENPFTPIFRILDATGLEYSPEVIVNRDALIANQWTINGDSEGTCELSVQDFSLNDFKIYPNPADNFLNIEGNNSIEKIEVYNLLGQKLLERNYNTENILLDISEFSSGIYLVKIFAKGQVKIFRVIKK